MGLVDHVQFLLNVIIIPFSSLGSFECILTIAKTKFIFLIFRLFHGLCSCRGSEVTVGSEDQLQKFLLSAYLFRRGQVEHSLTMVNLKSKPSIFTLRLTADTRFLLLMLQVIFC